MKRALWCLALALVGLLASAGAAWAQGPLWSDEELTDRSEVIVTARVVRVVPGWDADAGAIYTYVTLNVTEVLKGWVPERRIVLKQLGGTIGDLGLVAFGQAHFVPKERVVAFLEVRPRDGTLYTAALAQGKWVVERSDRRRMAMRFLGPAGPLDRRRMRPFRDRILRWAGEASRQPSPSSSRIVTRPPEAPGPGQRRAETPDAQGFEVWGVRWHEADDGTSIRVDMESGGQPGLSGGGSSEIAAARGYWNGAGAKLDLATGSSRRARCHGAAEFDGRISITFMDPCGEMSNSGGILASATGWHQPSNTRTVNGVTFTAWIQATVVFNDSASALSYITVPRCFQDITAHELGHTVGLLHSSDSGALMYPYIDSACLTAGLASAITGGIGQDDADGLKFIYPPDEGGGDGGDGVDAPSVPTLVSPSGTISDTSPTYVWESVQGAGVNRYQVQINTSEGGTIWNDGYGPNDCSGSTCELNPSTTLSNGSSYTWRVRARNSAGWGSWSSTGSFTVDTGGGDDDGDDGDDDGTPSAPTLVSPSGTISDTSPTYVWESVQGAGVNRYQVQINTSEGGTIWDDGYDPNDCSGNTCELNPSTTLSNGSSYTWWVRAHNDSGWGSWSSTSSFTVDTGGGDDDGDGGGGDGTPSAPTLSSPTGTISDSSPTYVWSAVSGAGVNRYQVQVEDAGSNRVWDDGYDPADCSGATCSLTPPTSLADATYTWHVRAHNSAGWGDWSTLFTFIVATE
ncbi:MAG TPA: matrixin family metalloprotease [Acidobacteriota bacterium]|nr:matrixin family metalloprotease [Acidobacteriota bacterium]